MAQEIKDLPAGLDLDNIDIKPQNQVASRQTASGSKEYKPSDFTVNKLNELPKADIKKTLGLDIDYLIANSKQYGVLEALASGEMTPSPVTIWTKGIKSLATVRIFPVEREPKWDCEVHKVNLRYALDSNNQPYQTRDGKWATEIDPNPLRKGEVLSYYDSSKGESVPFSPDEMDRLRLTGHLGDVKRGTNSKGEEVSTLYSVDPWNNHELCRVSGKAVRARLFPAVYAKVEGGSENLAVRSNGCNFNAGGVVCVDVSIYNKEGKALADANGKKNILLPVNAAANVALEGNKSLNLSSAQVGRLASHITYFNGEDQRVVSYLSAKQLGEIAQGHGVWVGEAKSMSFVVNGKKEDMSLSPVTDKGFSAHVQYDAARGKIVKSPNFKYAKDMEIAKEQKEAREKEQNIAPENSIAVGQHV